MEEEDEFLVDILFHLILSPFLKEKPATNLGSSCLFDVPDGQSAQSQLSATFLGNLRSLNRDMVLR